MCFCSVINDVIKVNKSVGTINTYDIIPKGDWLLSPLKLIRFLGRFVRVLIWSGSHGSKHYHYCLHRYSGLSQKNGCKALDGVGKSC